MASVLVVDDSLYTRKSLSTLLQQAGHEVIAEASNGLQAFSAYIDYKPDLVTMDITMPVVNGIDATKNIIELFPNANIIMISSISEKHMIFESLQLGAKNYIIKPFTYDKVLSVLDKVLKDSPESNTQDSITPGKSKYETEIEENLLPYTIETYNGKFIINILSNIKPAGYELINDLLNEFKYIKPLKIILNFSEIEFLDETSYSKVLEISDKIKSLQGNMLISAKSQSFVASIIRRGLDIPISLYSYDSEIKNLLL